jgi:hypothetical protein
MDNPAAPPFVRDWTKADKGGLSVAMRCPLVIESGHGASALAVISGYCKAKLIPLTLRDASTPSCTPCT